MCEILSLSTSEAGSLGIGKSTLHYLCGKARGKIPFEVYQDVLTRLGGEQL